MSGTRKPPQPPAQVPAVDACPDCLRPAGARHQHARECPRNEAARRRRGVDWNRSAMFREQPDLGALVRHLARHLQDPARPPGPVWLALAEVLQPEYLEALRSKLEDEVPGRVSEELA